MNAPHIRSEVEQSAGWLAAAVLALTLLFFAGVIFVPDGRAPERSSDGLVVPMIEEAR